MEFIELLVSGQTFKLSSLPPTLLSYFNNFGVDNSTEQTFYYLKLSECKSAGLILEITAVKAEAVDRLVCNKYQHMGIFQNNSFNRYEMNHLLCNASDSCKQLNTNECVGYYGEFNCTLKSLSPCKCDPEKVAACKVISEVATDNFVYVYNKPEFVAVATNAKAYTVTQNDTSLTKLVPQDHVVAVVLNQNDILTIGEVHIRGKSKKPTYIPHIITPDFTVPPLPTTGEPIHFDYVEFKKGYYLEFIIGFAILAFGAYICVRRFI